MAKVLLMALICISFTNKHPFYLSVTEMNYNAKEKSIQTSVKLFTNDLEDALKKIYKQPVDLINGKDKDAINKMLNEYIQKHLTLTMEEKLQKFDFVGFEHEEEAVWIYIEYKNCPKPKKVIIENTLLYDFISNQINIVNFDALSSKKNSKLTNPEKKIQFEF